MGYTKNRELRNTWSYWLQEQEFNTAIHLQWNFWSKSQKANRSYLTNTISSSQPTFAERYQIVSGFWITEQNRSGSGYHSHMLCTTSLPPHIIEQSERVKGANCRAESIGDIQPVSFYVTKWIDGYDIVDYDLFGMIHSAEMP